MPNSVPVRDLHSLNTSLQRPLALPEVYVHIKSLISKQKIPKMSAYTWFLSTTEYSPINIEQVNTAAMVSFDNTEFPFHNTGLNKTREEHHASQTV